jgi:membrane protein DedA with SNARE-associated domain
MSLYSALVALIVGVVLLVLGYQLPQAPSPVHQLLLIFGYILAIIGGILVLLLALGLPLAIGR